MLRYNPLQMSQSRLPPGNRVLVMSGTEPCELLFRVIPVQSLDPPCLDSKDDQVNKPD